MNPSIRRRLLVALLSATVAAWTLTAVTSYLDIRYQVDQLFDAQLAQSARVLLALNTVTIEQKAQALNKAENPTCPAPPNGCSDTATRTSWRFRSGCNRTRCCCVRPTRRTHR
jgi:hypothetical protein